jgi:hypothetical protein
MAPNIDFQNPFGANVFAEFFETPGVGTQAAYQSALPQGMSPNLEQFAQSQFQNVFNEFLGVLGSQIRGGQDPTAQFGQFAQEFAQDFPSGAGYFGPGTGRRPLAQRFAALPPSLRFGTPQRFFAPPTRQIFF